MVVSATGVGIKKGRGYDLFVVNSCFRKRASHLVTFQSGPHCSQIDFILARRDDRHACLDCKVIPRECVVPQHRLVVANFRFQLCSLQRKQIKVKMTKWWKLKKDAAHTLRKGLSRRPFGRQKMMQMLCG